MLDPNSVEETLERVFKENSKELFRLKKKYHEETRAEILE